MSNIRRLFKAIAKFKSPLNVIIICFIVSFTAADAPEVTFIPTYFSNNQSLIKITAAFNDTVAQVSVYLAVQLVLCYEIWRFLHD